MISGDNHKIFHPVMAISDKILSWQKVTVPFLTSAHIDVPMPLSYHDK